MSRRATTAKAKRDGAGGAILLIPHTVIDSPALSRSRPTASSC